MNELKGYGLAEVNPIERRANSKIVAYNNRYFLVGGMTADAVSNQIFQFRLNNEHEPTKLEWKQIHFTNNLFSPRNSFAACAAKTFIYVWGGLELLESNQKCLSDLIQIDIQKGRMRLLPLKQQIKIHSSSLAFDQQSNQLIAYGGTDQNSNLPAYLYRLKLNTQNDQYQWIRTKIKGSQTQAFVWQHSSNLSNFSFFAQQQGKFLTVVGGCRFPHSPYKSIVQINLETNTVTQQILLEQGLTAHDSVERNRRLYIFGGSNGGDFSCIIYVLQKGKVTKLKGHKAIGCCCCLMQNKMLVYGGVCGPLSINGAFIYQ